MAWIKVWVDHDYRYYLGPAGAVGSALGTTTVGGVDFSLKVEIETDQECKIRDFTPVPVAIPGAGVRVISSPTIHSNKTSADKKGCKDSNGLINHWDKLTVNAIWIIESLIPIPIWTPFSGLITIPNPFSSQQTIQLESIIYPNGGGKPTKELKCWVNGVLQYDHS